MAKDVSTIIEANVESGVWLQTSRPHWYSSFSTGSELDLIIMLVLLPAILITHLIPNRRNHSTKFLEHDGRIYCALSEFNIHFISGKGTWVGDSKLDKILKTVPNSDLLDIVFEHAHNTPVKFRFSNAPDLTLYFGGVWSDLVEFKDASLAPRKSAAAE